jgi:hypothetical protein
MKLRPLTTVFAFLISCGVGLKAQTFIWTGLGSTSYYDGYYDGDNWQDRIAPADFEDNTGNDTIVFGNVRNTLVRYSEIKAHQLQFTGHTRPYQLEAFGGATIYLGSGGIVYSPSGNVRTLIDDSISLTASQTWNITGGALTVKGAIWENGGSRTLTKTGAGTLVLEPGYYDESSFSGGLDILDGRVVVQPNYTVYYYPYYFTEDAPITAFGSGTVTFNSSGGGVPTLVARRLSNYEEHPLIVPNAIAINGTMTTENQSEVILSGPISLLSNATLAAQGNMLSIQGGISGDGKTLTIDSSTLVVLVPGESDSTNTYTGGTHVARGLLVFGDEVAIPASGTISVSNFGYAGLAAPEYGTSNFVAKFDGAETHGTLGFDSDPSRDTNVFEGPVNLTGFSATARLGSATKAILDADSTITPQGTDYRFGGGGGYLTVNSSLTGARNLVGASPSSLPLTVYLGNVANDFTGNVSAAHTAFIFANGALPAGAALQLHPGGYIGQVDAADPQAFLDRFPTTTNHGMIGLNGSSFTTTITADLDLSAITGNVYLGTTQRGYTDDGVGGGVRLQGIITPANSGNYRFAGYKGGLLRVESSLTGSTEVHIGDPNTPATYGDFNEKEISTVALMGDNSGLSGNVLLFGGQLYLGHEDALGSGALVVQGMPLPAEWTGDYGEPLAPQLALGFDGSLANNVILNSRLDIAEYYYADISGQISGSGQLYLQEDSQLTLSANNTFSGGIYVSSNSSLYLAANQASGTGPLAFGSSGGGGNGHVYFETTNPVIGGLASGDGDYTEIYSTRPDTILTVNQSGDSSFSGYFYIQGEGQYVRLVKEGAGTLRLNSGGFYPHGVANADLGGTRIGLQVNEGTLVINNFYIEQDSTIWVNGGTLAVENRYLGNALVVDNGGRLAGHGGFSNATIGNGAVLSPGLAGKGEIGSLGFHHLELNSGGTLEWQIKDPSGAQGEGYDHINVFNNAETLVINATSESPFSIKVISLNSGGNGGLLAGLTPGESYSWTLFSFDALSGGFDPAKFALDLSLFQTALGNGLDAGDFSLSLSGDNLMLNFTAVPEPSTYALMGIGLTFIGWTMWRRRRA